MSNFGQSSLGNTKVGACGEHEDSGRGECFMPGLIRPDRNYKEASPSKEKDEEGEGRKREREGEGKINCKGKWYSGMLCDFKTHMSEFVNATQWALHPEIRLQYSSAGEKKKEHKCNEKPNKKMRSFKWDFNMGGGSIKLSVRLS